MDLENKALPAPSTGESTARENASLAVATSLNVDINSSSPDDSSPNPNDHNEGKRNRKTSYTSGMSRVRKRKRVEGTNSVEIYNVPPLTGCDVLEDFIKNQIFQMHGKKISSVTCRCSGNHKSAKDTFIVSFETSEFVDLAISLSGVQFLQQTIYVSIYKPDSSLEKTRNALLCFHHCFGACDNNCIRAHGVLDLKLCHETVLREKRTIYINNVPFNYPPQHLLNMVRKKFNNHGVYPFFTAFHFRHGKRDALIEFADIRHAKRAQEVLSGARVGQFDLEVLPWKLEWQSFFVDYFCKQEAKERHSDAELECGKRELRRLREEVYELKCDQRSLEKKNSAYKGQLDEAYDDVRYYRDKYEREKSGARRLEDKLDDLRRENDDLARDNDLLVRENDDLRSAHYSSRSLGTYRDMDKSFQGELLRTRLKNEGSRDQVYDVKCELHKTVKENDVLVRDSKSLRGLVGRLAINRNSFKMENQQDEIQRQLDEALSKIEALNGVVTTTQLQLKDMESEKKTMNEAVTDLQAENETLQEEMEQMRMNHAMELGFTGAGETQAIME